MLARTALVVTLILISSATLPAQVPVRAHTPAVAPITAITITGNNRLGTDAILYAAGVTVGQDGGPTVFDAARDRLLATGYFDVVSYTFRQQDSGFSITFTVTEMKQSYPVRVEGLPISVAEVTQVLKSKDPLFNGLLPGTKPVIDRAAAAIGQYLGASKPDLNVRGRVVATGPEIFAVEFVPAEGLPVIADVTFDGSALIGNTELHLAMIEGAIGQRFSDTGIHELLDKLIRPLFEKQGHMRVSFPQITSKPAAGVKGVDVHVTVVDGPQFRLGDVSVRGPMSGDARRILRMASVPHMDTLDYGVFIDAVSRISDTLHGEGYLDSVVSTDRSIDDANRMVDVWFNVNPGDLYKFGRLDVIGLGLDGEAAIRKMWSVKPGDPFPAGYQNRFAKAVKEEELFDNLGEITVTPNINRQTHIVDVVLFFAAAPPSQRPHPARY